MTQTAKKNLIFDLDGTLIDSSPSILAGFSAALAQHKIEAKLPLTAAIIGPPLKETLSQLAGSKDAALIDSLANAFKAFYDTEGYKATEVFPGIDSMLRDLHAESVQLHIATNKRLLPTQLILQHFGWRSLFTSVFALDVRSPAFTNKAAMVAGQISELGIEKATAAYIGDRPEDGHAADANQLTFYAAEWGYSAFPEDEWQAHWIRLRSADELIARIQKTSL